MVQEKKQDEDFEYLLHKVYSNHPDGVIIFNKQNLIQYINPVLIDMIGRELDDLIGKTLEESSHPTMSLETAKTLNKRMEKRLKSGESLVGVEVDIIGKEGKPMHVSYSASVIRDDNEKIIGVIAIIRDLTERERAQAN